ncbi:MAG TPA: PCRF domain-containing protein, partial [Thermopetrobacter sp.]|nr:PCRF domain-containing protein [Thermopetrobacter sp.]
MAICTTRRRRAPPPAGAGPMRRRPPVERREQANATSAMSIAESPRIDRILARFEEVERELAGGAAGEAYVRLSREYAELEPVVATIRELRAARRELADLQELAGDPEMADMARAEMPALKARIAELERRLRVQLLPRDAADDRGVILEVRAGTGGEEAALFAADLFRMYQRYAEARGWRVEVMSASPTERGGYREIIAAIRGRGAYARLKYESGVHRVQRVPET